MCVVIVRWTDLSLFRVAAAVSVVCRVWAGQVNSSAVLEALTAREVRDVIRMVGDDEFGKVRPEIRSAVAEMLPLAVPSGEEDGVEPTRAAL